MMKTARSYMPKVNPQTKRHLASCAARAPQMTPTTRQTEPLATRVAPTALAGISHSGTAAPPPPRFPRWAGLPGHLDLPCPLSPRAVNPGRVPSPPWSSTARSGELPAWFSFWILGAGGRGFFSVLVEGFNFFV